MATHPEATERAALRPSERQVFFGWLVLATLVPYTALLLYLYVFPRTKPLANASTALLFLGAGGHVAASFFFYGEPRMRAFMLGQKARYLIAPALIVACSALLFALGDVLAKSHALLGYWVWQTHHFTRQNHGILAFVSRAEGVNVTTGERTAIALTGVSAILGMIGFITPYQNTLLAAWEWQLHTTGLGVYLAAWAFFLLSLRRCAARSSRLRVGVTLLLMLFYAPLFIVDSVAAVYMYLIAHGLQYLVFMSFVAAKPAERRVRAAGALVAWTLLGGFVIWAMQRGVLYPEQGAALYGASLGIVMWHFVLDAGVWRLSERFQRGYMAERFAFLRSGS